jgi:hypothetical protein
VTAYDISGQIHVVLVLGSFPPFGYKEQSKHNLDGTPPEKTGSFHGTGWRQCYLRKIESLGERAPDVHEEYVS